MPKGLLYHRAGARIAWYSAGRFPSTCGGAVLVLVLAVGTVDDRSPVAVLMKYVCDVAGCTLATQPAGSCVVPGPPDDN